MRNPFANWTDADVALFNERNGHAKALPAEGEPMEADLHAKIFHECRRRGWIAFHGSMAERTHRTAGEPDFICLLPSGNLLMVECKSRTGKLSPAQQAMAAHASKLGHTIHLVRSFQEFLSIL